MIFFFFFFYCKLEITTQQNSIKQQQQQIYTNKQKTKLVSNFNVLSTAQGHLRTMKLCYKQPYTFLKPLIYMNPFSSQFTKPISTQT